MEKRIRFSLNPNTPSTARDGSPKVHYGILEGDTVYETLSLESDQRGPAYPFSGVRLLPPCWPSKIVCVGRNYAEHARELGNPLPSEPLIFLKPPSSLVASGDNIVYPARFTERVDYEGEWGAVIGRRARHVKAGEAADYVLGYTVVNDVTARDLQRKDGQWTRGKGFDTFCAAGPWMTPRAQFDPADARLRTLLDGEVKQEAALKEMIFSLGDIIAYITSFMTLEPGDLIATGTPEGVGPMQPGSEVSVEIEGIGTLRNRIAREVVAADERSGR